eukprot:363223-Chlamydomonas_euryale.AAC.7
MPRQRGWLNGHAGGLHAPGAMRAASTSGEGTPSPLTYTRSTDPRLRPPHAGLKMTDKKRC